MTIYHLAEVAADRHMTIYATTHTEQAAQRMLRALHAAGHPGVQIVPVGRESTFAEQFEAMAA